MGITREELNLRVVVRRVATGSTPYGWAVHEADAFTPLHTAPDRFRGMQAAYEAGQAWLTDYLSSRRASSPKRLRSRWDDADALMDIQSQLQADQEEDTDSEQQQPVEPPDVAENWLTLWREQRSQSSA